MTFKDFKNRVSLIEKQRFETDTGNPVDFGIERALFKEAKLEELISLAKETDSKVAEGKLEQWQRQVKLTRNRRRRLQQTRVSSES